MGSGALGGWSRRRDRPALRGTGTPQRARAPPLPERRSRGTARNSSPCWMISPVGCDRTNEGGPPLVIAGALPEGVTRELILAGQSIFLGRGACFACHGEDATGARGVGANLTDAEWWHTDGSWAGIVARVRAGVPVNSVRNSPRGDDAPARRLPALRRRHRSCGRIRVDPDGAGSISLTPVVGPHTITPGSGFVCSFRPVCSPDSDRFRARSGNPEA